MKKTFWLLVVSLLLSTSAMADVAPDLVVKTGSSETSVYGKLFAQLSGVCKSPTMVGSLSGGSIQALDSLMSNEANLAFIQSDVIIGRKLIENDPQIEKVRIFMPLFYSELHIIAQRSNNNINKFSDLSQKKIGSYGGAYITSRILFGNSGVRPFQVLQYSSEAEALAALKAGTVEAIMIVAGQPASWAKDLSGSVFKLVPFDRMDVLAKTGSYTQTNLRYPNLSQTTIPAVSVQIDLVTYDYKSAEKVRSLSKLKTCIAANIDDLRETTGNHPKWNEIKPNAKVTYWPMFVPKQ